MIIQQRCMIFGSPREKEKQVGSSKKEVKACISYVIYTVYGEI